MKKPMPKYPANNNRANSSLAATRQAAVDFLYSRIDYERALSVPYGTRQFKLQRMRRLLSLTGNPQRGMPIIHIAGTKGKGSTAALLSGMLTAAGFRVGLFSSPHLERLEERIAVDARACTAAELIDLVERLRPAVAEMDREAELLNEKNGNDDEYGPTFFEITTAMALVHFARLRVDLVLLEVGLGGRLDSTNVCDPLVSVITNVSFDHTQQLGDTLSAIAREKAGIVKPGVPLVSGVSQGEPRGVIREVCRRQNAELIELGRDFSFRYIPPSDVRPRGLDYDGKNCRYRDLHLGLVGAHQGANAAVALAVIEQLRTKGWNISEASVRRGLAETRCPGRVELLGRRPTVVIDTAHNRAAIEALLPALDELHASGRRLLILAATQDKDIEGMLAALRGRFERIIFTRYQRNPRGAAPRELADIYSRLGGGPYEVHDKPADAWQAAVAHTAADDLICVTGSFYLVAELRSEIMAFLAASSNSIPC